MNQQKRQCVIRNKLFLSLLTLVLVLCLLPTQEVKAFGSGGPCPDCDTGHLIPIDFNETQHFYECDNPDCIHHVNPNFIAENHYGGEATIDHGPICDVCGKEYNSRYSITVVGGTADKTTATAGETVTITADNPQEGMCWVQWDLTDGIGFAQSDAATTTFTMPARPVTVHAIFKGIILKQLDDQTYTGEAFEPKFGLFGVSLDGVDGIYQEGIDYDISYANNINAGTATVTVMFKGHWIGHKSTTFTIKPAYVYPDIVIECENQVYTGEELSPIATVTWKGKTLVNGIDYNLICPNWAEDNAIHVGKVSVAVRGIGNFEGDAVVYFYITPRPVTITVDNASKTSGEVDPAFTGTVVGLVNENDLGEITYSRTNTDETVGTYQGVLTATYTANPDYIVTVVNGDFTIIQAHTVIYKVVNGTWADGTTTDLTETVADGANPSNVPTGMLPSAGYTGGAWDIDPVSAAISGNMTFTYTFVEGVTPPVPTTSTITIDPNGGHWPDGTTAPRTYEVEVGKIFTLPPAPTRSGFSFCYWKGSEYQPGQPYTVTTADHTFTAQWSRNYGPDEPTSPVHPDTLRWLVQSRSYPASGPDLQSVDAAQTSDGTTTTVPLLPRTGESSEPMVYGLIFIGAAAFVLVLKKKVV